MTQAKVKLTEAMRRALTALAEKPGSAYSLKVGLNTLGALGLKRLVSAPSDPGAMLMPHTALWRITPAGRAALSQEGEG